MAQITNPVKGMFGLGDFVYDGYRISCIEYKFKDSHWFLSRKQATEFRNFCHESKVNSLDDFEKKYQQFIKLLHESK
jgi:hypothetical protein